MALKSFRFNSFLGMSASMFLLIEGKEREELFSSVKSTYLRSKLYNLKIETEYLRKLFENTSIDHNWAIIWDSLKDNEEFGLIPLFNNIEGIDEKTYKIATKRLYHMGKDFVNNTLAEENYKIIKEEQVQEQVGQKGQEEQEDILAGIDEGLGLEGLEDLEGELENIETIAGIDTSAISDNAFEDLTEDILDNLGDLDNLDSLEDMKDKKDKKVDYLANTDTFLYNMFKNGDNALREFVKEFIEECDTLGFVKNEFTTIEGKQVELSVPAYNMYKYLYERRNTLYSIDALIEERLGSTGGEFTSQDKIFGVKIFNLKTLKAGRTAINDKVNQKYIEVVASYFSNDRGSDLSRTLDEYERDCQNLEKLVNIQEEGEEEECKCIKLKGYMDDHGEIMDFMLTENLRLHLHEDEVLPEEEIDSDELERTLSDLYKIPNFRELLELKLDYVYDILRIIRVLKSFTPLRYTKAFGVMELEEDRCMDLFMELSHVGIIGLTTFAYEHFVANMRDDTMREEKFRLQKDSVLKLYTNSILLQKDIASKRFFLE